MSVNRLRMRGSDGETPYDVSYIYGFNRDGVLIGADDVDCNGFRLFTKPGTAVFEVFPLIRRQPCQLLGIVGESKLTERQAAVEHYLNLDGSPYHFRNAEEEAPR